MLFGIVVFALIVLGLFSFVATYNGLVSASEKATRAWADLDALLTQRHDEIPKVVEMCEPHLRGERALFERLLGAREAVFAARQSRDADALGRSDRALRTLINEILERAQTSGGLGTSAAFGLLRQRHATLDSEIAGRREQYNNAVREYTTAIARAPGNVVAIVAQFPRWRPVEPDAAT